MFTPAMIEGLEWQQIVPVLTRAKRYRVEITWALDRFRISVRTNTGILLRSKFAWCGRTACATANKFIRQYEKIEHRIELEATH